MPASRAPWTAGPGGCCVWFYVFNKTSIVEQNVVVVVAAVVVVVGWKWNEMRWNENENGNEMRWKWNAK